MTAETSAAAILTRGAGRIRSYRARADLGDRAWRALLGLLGGVILVIAGVIVAGLVDVSHPALRHAGAGRFLLGREWDPVAGIFGALPFIYGTLVTSAVAIVLAVPISIGMALFLSEMAPSALRPVVSFAVETLAAIPSVVYGLWGLFVLVPLLRSTVEPLLSRALGSLPLFQGAPLGLGYLAAGLILAIMILPTVSSVSLEVLKTMPQPLREGALALGATRWEAIRSVILPYSRAGIFGAALLGLGRALGETMAVTMVIGNSPQISASLFAPGYSLPSVIANEFAEATGALHTGALAGLALVLFGITAILNALARLLMHAMSSGPARVAV